MAASASFYAPMNRIFKRDERAREEIGQGPRGPAKERNNGKPPNLEIHVPFEVKKRSHFHQNLRTKTVGGD